MVRLKGRIVGESEKALKVEITEDENSKLTGKIVWIPKSQLRLDTKDVEFQVPEWVYEFKVNE